MPHRISTRSWGLAKPPQMNAAASRAEARWRWPVLIALMCTVPAFYIELLDNLPTPLAIGIYLSAALLVMTSLWRVARQLPQPLDYLRANALDLVLMAGLLAAASLPPSAASHGALAARLIVSMLTLARMVWAIKSWVTRGGLTYLLLIALVVFVLCGVGFWALEPGVQGLGEGLWLAFTTAATVGYGDLVPTTPAARIFAVFVVLLGYAVLSLVTAAIAAMWVETSEHRMEQDILRDMHAQLRELREDIQLLREQLAEQGRERG
ncbi:potassium channel family protein [Pelomonas sp. V22]|uniref:potassium channel family protein n=1 Tax=Pelomonas sp. V22 TaxID=2822139 RepID=UPI0024A94EAD|nr:potassium channel family protein [Pelomonas sp. V22]